MLLQSAENPAVYRVHADSVTADEILEAALEIMQMRYAKGATFSTVDSAKHFLKHALGSKDREVFGVVFLDSAHRMIAYEEMFQGSISGAPVYPREIIKRALQLNAAVILLAHNHPSGNSNPSPEDVSLTNKIIEACNLVDIRTIDHMIVGKTVYSFRENNNCFN